MKRKYLLKTVPILVICLCLIQISYSKDICAAGRGAGVGDISRVDHLGGSNFYMGDMADTLFSSGDVNNDGVTDIADVIMASEIAVGYSDYTTDQIARANVSNPGSTEVDISDVILIAEYSVNESESVFASDDFEAFPLGSFSGGGWTSSGGTWSIIQDGSHAVYQSAAVTTGMLTNGDLSWTNYSISTKVKCATGGTIVGRYQDSGNYYMLKLTNNGLFLQKKVANVFTTLDKVSFAVNSTVFYTLKLEMNGDSVRGYVDGVHKVSATDTSFQSGKIGLRCEDVCTYDDVEVYQMLPTAAAVPASYPGLRDANGNAVPTPAPHAVTGVTRSVAADTADNANDDRPAIEAAINAAQAGDEVYLPNGVYNLNSPWSADSSANIRLKNGVNIRGQSQSGVILKTSFDVGINDDYYCVVIRGTGVSNILISNLTVTSTFNRQYSSDCYTQNPYRGGPRYGIHLSQSGSTYTNNVVIDSVTVEKFAGYGGILMNNTHHVAIKNSDFKNATEVCKGGYGVNLDGANCFYNVVDNCNFIGADTGYLRHGLLTQYAHNNLFKNNLFQDVLLDALDFHGEGEYNSEACGNTFFNITGEAAIGVGNPGATHDAAGPDNWIHNNMINNCYAGIKVFYGSQGTVLQNNEIFNAQVTNARGITLGHAPDTVVQGNYIHDNTAGNFIGIWLVHDAGSVWTDGSVHNPGDPTDIILTDNRVIENYRGIQIEAGSTAAESGNMVSGNTMRNYIRVLNPSFEYDGAEAQMPALWSETGDADASSVTNAGAYSGLYELRMWSPNAFNVTVSQTVPVPNNTYTLQARVKSTGGQTTAAMTASGFGGTQKSKSIKAAASSWTLYAFGNIAVTNGSCTIGFTADSPGNQTLEIDSVELYY